MIEGSSSDAGIDSCDSTSVNSLVNNLSPLTVDPVNSSTTIITTKEHNDSKYYDDKSANIGDDNNKKILQSNDSSPSDRNSAYSTPCSSSEKLNDAISQQTLKYQEQLKEGAKIRMKNKFDQLEQETGIKLRRHWSKDKDSGDESIVEEESIVDLQASDGEDSEACKYREEKRKKSSSLQAERNKDDEIQVLRQNLLKIQEQLKTKDEEIAKLTRIRGQVEIELEDLTASLFEEANKMIRSEFKRKEKFERDYREATMKLSVFEAEVKALKLLLVTSTPSSPNLALHPHLERNKNSRTPKKSELFSSWASKYSPFSKPPKNNTNKSNSAESTPKKSPSNYELGGSLNLSYESNGVVCDLGPQFSTSSICEVDPVFYQQFLEWKRNPSLDRSSDFINSIYENEIKPAFNFKNQELTKSVLTAIEDNTIAIESASARSSFPKKCALLDIPRACKYRLKLGNDYHYISSLCRNRITAVCDLFCYLRYIQQGLVKSSFQDSYWEVMLKRKDIALARFGFQSS
ncbi:guanine nucleotide exchange factor for Rab-3A-like [Brevipalpus obovatus]|uniref:guanine nucleotide exchange factor for Rab-3A-like n=1 Tax=Brevipalpus obovatus TaxID=246614 RepID=UPI003D9F1C40